MANKIYECIDYLRAAPQLEMLLRHKIGRCHSLEGNRKGQYAMDLVHPYRLIFIPEDDTTVSVLIEEIADYH